MKIIKEAKETNTKVVTKKLTEDDELVAEDETVVLNPTELDQDLEDGTAPDASTADLADAVIAEVELATDGEETYSESKAQAIAKKIKAACSDFDRATWAPLKIPHKFTKALDKCLANARFFKYHGSSAGTDLLVTGLPGSGKTAIFNAWCRERGVQFKYINAKDEDLSAAINGFSVHEVNELDGKKVHTVVQAGSTKLVSLIDTPTVLFLDEFNRAPHQLRAQLLTLVNEHRIAGDDPNDPTNTTGFIDLQGLLFTVMCINPAVGTDPGAMALNQAELGRAVSKLTVNSNASDALNYFKSYFTGKIKELDPSDPTYKYSYTRYARTLNLALALVTDPRFDFDDAEDQTECDLATPARTLLSQRILTDGLEGNGYSKEEFLDWVDNESELLDSNIEMFHEILDDWVEPEVKVPGLDDDAVADEADGGGSDTANATAFTDDEESDILSQLENGEEEDVDLFGSTATAAGKAAVVSAQDALSRIKSFDFTL